ncbi:hypothetical protein JQK19_03685 [Chromobacterium violaceum]|uniref:hypothetical protein n=1 Tax=Chromobacterium violaceum TaxID=536 RepID=UPI001BE9617C|nr:hypothetical protein [Chromobacterium violaceum]MBT2866333.1 hypothetical protein [Chromobacterium violaceum]
MNSGFIVKGKKITFLGFSDDQLKKHFENGSILIDIIDDVVFLGANTLHYKELNFVLYRTFVDKNPLTMYNRIIVGIYGAERFEYRIEEHREYHWFVRATYFDAHQTVSANLARTVHYEGYTGYPSEDAVNFALQDTLRMAHEADLTPEYDNRRERWIASESILKDVPARLSKEQYREICRRLGIIPKTDGKATEYCAVFKNFPVSCDYLPADKIAEVILHLRRGATIMEYKLKNNTQPRNPMGFQQNQTVTCYFCKTKGWLGMPPFNSALAFMGQTPVCNRCLG